MDIQGPKLIWCGITHHIIYIYIYIYIIFYFSFSFYFLQIMESQIAFLSWHVMTNLHVTKDFFIILKKNCQYYFLTPSKHDLHACVFTTMYMFVNCIRTRYIKNMYPSRIKSKTSWNHIKVLTTKPLQYW